MMGGAQELGLLAVAFVLSSIIGFEREIRQRSAGLKTHTLVGVGAALFTLAGRFGFGEPVNSIDASRIAAQVVVGIGFIGGGVVFVRHDGVKGLTTAATVWLTAAIGLAAGAGVVGLAVAATVVHLIVTLVYTPLTRRLPASRITLTSVEVSYRDGLGVLRDVLTATTDLGYVISNVEVTRSDEQRDIVAVSLEAEGKRGRDELVESIQGLAGVVDVRSMDRSE
jgi:putative Mg2+ transporter-C (MgtC) family protein